MKLAPAEHETPNPNAEVEQRIRDARARRETLEKARSDREEAEALQRRLADEERALKDAEALEAAEAKFDKRKLATVETEMGVIIVKRPHAAIFKRFQDQGSTNTKQLEELVRPSIVHPTISEFEAIVEELPATLLRVANAVSRLAGIRAEEVAGKV